MPYHIPAENLVVKSYKGLRSHFGKNIPPNPSPLVINPLGAFEIETGEKPEHTDAQILVRSDLPTHANGVSFWTWNVRDLTEQELLDRVPWQTLADAQFELATWINKLTYQVDGKYPQIVKEGWGEEEAMAVAFMTGTETPEQLAKLQTLAATKK